MEEKIEQNEGENTIVSSVENAPLDVAGNVPKEETVSAEENPGQEKLSGVSTASFNEEQLRREVYNRETAFDIISGEKHKPTFFIKDNDTASIEVDVLTHPQTGRVMSVTKSGYGIDFESEFSYFEHTLLKFEFTIPNYIQLAEYRRRSTELDSETDKPIIDRVKLREFLLVNHLKKWNIPDSDDNVIPLTFDNDGALSEVSLFIAHSLAPAILDVVLTVFEKDILLI